MSARRADNLLCVSNYPSGTGFAWDFIESLYGDLANRLEVAGVRTWVAFPRLEGDVGTLAGSCAHPLEHRVALGNPGSMLSTAGLVRQLGIGMVYFSDRASWHPGYSLLRVAGVRWIVVHDHTSGRRTVPQGLKRGVKRLRHALPGSLADRVVAVSDFVARRKVRVDLVPEDRVVRIWNSVELAASDGEADPRARFGIPRDAPLVICACRTSPEKGVHHLLRAFDRLLDRWRGGTPPRLVYMGEGPAMEELRALHSGLRHPEAVVMPGYVKDAAAYYGGADLAVVPSVWEEAFGLAALEPLAAGIPVVASEVGGIPEVVRGGTDGLLVPPGDEPALTRAMEELLLDPDRRTAMGRAGRRRVRRDFTREGQVSALERLFREAL